MSRNELTDNKSTGFVADETIVKKAKRTRVYQPNSDESRVDFARRKVEADNVAKTRKLLDGAIALASLNVKTNRKLPTFTRSQWVWHLAGSYYLTHSYPPLIEEAAQRFKNMGRQNLCHWAAQKAIEERGHDKLALLDIQSMGYNAEAIVETLIPPSAVVLVNYFTRSLQAPNPIGGIGYTYTMERIATGIKEKHIQSVEAMLPQGIHATRCLRAHSSLSADVKHVEETVEVIAGLVPEERLRIAVACYETALLYFNSAEEDYIAEEKLQNALRPLESPLHIYSLT